MRITVKLTKLITLNCLLILFAILVEICLSPLPDNIQVNGDCLEVKREYYQNSSVLDYVTQCSQSAAHLCEQFLQFQQIGFVTLGPLRCA